MSWHSYGDAAEQKNQLQLEIAKREKRGETFEAFPTPTSRNLAQNFWGQAWCRHLETYCGYETRLPAGRTCLRAGNVYNLTVEKGRITADVTGASLYEVIIQVQPLPPDKWAAIRITSHGLIASLLDLLSGKLGDHLLRLVVDPDRGLFPLPREIRHQCTCPDSADLCQHQAAVLYAVGVLFDRDPKFLFDLRATNPSELIASAAASLVTATGPSSPGLENEDLSALFGIDLTETDPAPAPPAQNQTKLKD